MGTKINEYPQAAALNDTDLLVMDQVQSGIHSTKSVSIGQITDKATSGLSGDNIPIEAGSQDSISDAVGSLSDLTTTNQDSLVKAVNEVDDELDDKPTNTAGSPFLKVKTTANITKSISANGYASILGSDIDLAEAGYTPVGIVSMYNTQSAGCFFGSFDCSVVSGSATFAIVKNTSTSNINATMNFKILFMRTTN